jgi:hypothetical protein
MIIIVTKFVGVLQVAGGVGDFLPWTVLSPVAIVFLTRNKPYLIVLWYIVYSI